MVGRRALNSVMNLPKMLRLCFAILTMVPQSLSACFAVETDERVVVEREYDNPAEILSHRELAAIALDAKQPAADKVAALNTLAAEGVEAVRVLKSLTDRLKIITDLVLDVPPGKLQMETSQREFLIALVKASVKIGVQNRENMTELLVALRQWSMIEWRNPDSNVGRDVIQTFANELWLSRDARLIDTFSLVMVLNLQENPTFNVDLTMAILNAGRGWQPSSGSLQAIYPLLDATKSALNILTRAVWGKRTDTEESHLAILAMRDFRRDLTIFQQRFQLFRGLNRGKTLVELVDSHLLDMRHKPISEAGYDSFIAMIEAMFEFPLDAGTDAREFEIAFEVIERLEKQANRSLYDVPKNSKALVEDISLAFAFNRMETLLTIVIRRPQLSQGNRAILERLRRNQKLPENISALVATLLRANP